MILHQKDIWQQHELHRKCLNVASCGCIQFSENGVPSLGIEISREENKIWGNYNCICNLLLLRERDDKVTRHFAPKISKNDQNIWGGKVTLKNFFNEIDPVWCEMSGNPAMLPLVTGDDDKTSVKAFDSITKQLTCFCPQNEWEPCDKILSHLSLNRTPRPNVSKY